MKIENIISIYKINTMNVSTAQILEAVPNAEKVDALEAAKLINKAVANIVLSEMDKDKAAAELDKVSRCNMCKKPGELITLSRNRPAFKCNKHNTINPIPIDLIKKFGYDYEPSK